MMIWLVLAVMTGAAAIAVLWPLTRAWTLRPAEADIGFYDAQLADIARDAARGLIGHREAEAARAEAARRLLRSRGNAPGSVEQGEGTIRRRRAASALAISMIPLISLGLYGVFGSPNLPAQPLAARLSIDPAQLSLGEAIGRIEAHLASNPEDGQGWALLGPIYLRVERPADAARAFAAANRLLGETPARLTDQAEAEILANGGIVSAETRALLARSLEQDPAQPKARFYTAVMLEQDGDRSGAREAYAALLAGAAPDAPWVPVVREKLAALGGVQGAPPAASAGQGVTNEAIRGMVASLAARLAREGGSVDDWVRLIRSYGVLGDADKARAALADARRSLTGDAAALERLDAAAREARLTDAVAQ